MRTLLEGIQDIVGIDDDSFMLIPDLEDEGDPELEESLFLDDCEARGINVDAEALTVLSRMARQIQKNGPSIAEKSQSGGLSIGDLSVTDLLTVAAR